MQDKLQEIEQKIAALDESDIASGNLSSLHSRRYDQNEQRVRLMQEFSGTLKSYGKVVSHDLNLNYLFLDRIH